MGDYESVGLGENKREESIFRAENVKHDKCSLVFTVLEMDHHLNFRKSSGWYYKRYDSVITVVVS